MSRRDDDRALQALLAPPGQGAGRALRVLVWYPRLATSGYSGPSANFLRLFAEGSDKLQFTLLTSARETAALPPGMGLRQLARLAGPLRKHQQVLLVMALLRWIAVHRRSFDVFYGLSAFHYSVVPAFFAHLLGLKAVIRPAGQFDYAPKPVTAFGRLAARLKLAMLRRLDGVVAINSHIRDQFIAYGLPPDRVCLAPNAVDVGRFAPSPSPAGENPLVVVHVGGWTPRKRLHVLVEALRLARASGVDVRVVSAGPRDDAEYAARLDARLEECGLAGSFRWVGEVSDIENVYRAGHLFCLPSAAEGMPNAMIEAMACGLPAIVTLLPGTADVVRDGRDGFVLAQPRDEAELAGQIAACMRAYAADPALLRQHGESARRRIVQMFSRDHTKARIEDFLVTVCA